MTSRKRRRKKSSRFESASALVMGRALTSSGFPLRWLRRVLLVLLLLTVAGGIWLTLDDRFYVYHADVTGTARVSPGDVFQASGLSGLHILWARPARIEARILQALPSLESARVSCQLPASCAIAVVERQPRIMWEENGRLWWIDADGFVFDARGVLPEGWLVRGPLPRDEEGQLDERVRVALAELWAAEPEIGTSIDYVPGRGLVIVDRRDWRVIVGHGAGMEMRLRILESLAASLEARGLTPQFVDVRFPEAPYYSLTNEW